MTKRIIVGVVAIAMVFSIFGSSISTKSANAQMPTGDPVTTNFNRNLTIGSTGSDVASLQTILVSGGYLVMPVGVNKGYFGSLTRDAVGRWQAANNITPTAGYFGLISRARMNSGGMPPAVNPCPAGYTASGVNPVICTPTSGGSNPPSSGGALSGGEASLENLTSHDGDDDDVEEGGMGDVAEFEFDVEDGDIRIERLDLSLETDASGSDEDEPWNTFDTLSLWADGAEIASEDVSDEDEWLENDSEPYEFRFSGLNYVVREGDSGKITVRAEAQDGIDGLSSSNDIAWTMFIGADGLRGIDGEGIDQYIGDTGETVSFDVTEEGGDDGLSVRSSSEDPDSTTLKVEDDGSSEWYSIFKFDLDSDDDSGDIELKDFPITLTTSDVVSEVFNDLKLVIDGEEYDDFGAFSSTTAATASTTFDIDGDAVVSGGERVTVELMAEFKTASTSSTYLDGATVSASVIGSQIEAEGADDVDVDGTATGDTHTLRIMGVNIDPTSYSSSDQAPDTDGTDNDVATFYVKADVEAFDQDVFIADIGSLAFTYQIEDSNGNVVSTASTTATSSTISSSADKSGSYYRVSENGSESFTFQVTFNPSADTEGRQFRLQILTIIFNDTADTVTQQTYTAAPASDFETPFKLIID